jgi:hypothetical protein
MEQLMTIFTETNKNIVSLVENEINRRLDLVTKIPIILETELFSVTPKNKRIKQKGYDLVIKFAQKFKSDILLCDSVLFKHPSRHGGFEQSPVERSGGAIYQCNFHSNGGGAHYNFEKENFETKIYTNYNFYITYSCRYRDNLSSVNDNPLTETMVAYDFNNKRLAMEIIHDKGGCQTNTSEIYANFGDYINYTHPIVILEYLMLQTPEYINGYFTKIDKYNFDILTDNTDTQIHNILEEHQLEMDEAVSNITNTKITELKAIILDNKTELNDIQLENTKLMKQLNDKNMENKKLVNENKRIMKMYELLQNELLENELLEK